MILLRPWQSASQATDETDAGDDAPPAHGAPDAPQDAGSVAPTPAPEPCPDGMLPVPGGTFVMGSRAGQGEENERPETRVTLDPYCLDRTEVTVAQYQVCVADTVGTPRPCPPAPTEDWPGGSADQRRCYSRMCNGARHDRATHPVNCVEWAMADAYCRWRGARLPTEAEWELAARGTEGRRYYPWGPGDPAPDRLNAVGSEHDPALRRTCGRNWGAGGRTYAGDDGYPFTAPVGSYPAGAGPYGHLDLAGNVGEWVADWYGPYTGRSITNPRGPDQTGFRVYRGGGWNYYDPFMVRGAYRYMCVPSVRHPDLGFRCARRGSEPGQDRSSALVSPIGRTVSAPTTAPSRADHVRSTAPTMAPVEVDSRGG